MLLDPEQIRAHLETDLPDDALTELIRAGEALIESHAGGMGHQIERFLRAERRIWTSRPISGVVQITERDKLKEDEEVIDDSDYLITGSRELTRVESGANPRSLWAQMVSVTYLPEDDSDLRIGVLIDLVKISAAYQGVNNERDGSVQVGHANYQGRINAALAPLKARRFPLQ